MKKIIQTLLLTGLLLSGSSHVYAQRGKEQPIEKTRKFLLRYISFIDTASSDAKENILKGIETVAEASKTDWISQYHAAFYNATIGVNKTDTVSAVKMLDKAGLYIQQAASLKKDESEIVLLSAMVKGMRIKINPGLGALLGPEVMKEYEKAKKLNEENPRTWLVLGESFMYMPEEAGGGKKKAKEYLKTALSKYANDTHEDPAWPSWGKDRAQMLLSQLEKNQ